MTARKQRFTVDLRLPDKPDEVLLRAKTIVNSMRGNKWFPTPDPPLEDVERAIAAFQDAGVAARSLTRGTVADRNAKQGWLETLLVGLRIYVERIANANPSHAAEIVTSASMFLRGDRRRGKLPFVVKKGKLPGAAELWVKVEHKRAGYHWQMSVDGGKTWIGLPPGNKGNTTVEGLESGRVYLFRFRVVTKDGPRDWSEPVEYRAP